VAADLIVGPLDTDVSKYVAGICKKHRLLLPAGAYAGDHADNTFISMLNDASFDLFNNFAAGLEGFRGPDAMEKTTFRSLPWWLESFWLPLDFAPPITIDGAFVGSTFRLLGDLERIRALASIDLAAAPPGYRDMRKDYRAWFNSESAQLSEDETLRWVWNALNDGAKISIDRKVPIMLAA
jgi:hypothetical protein